VRRETLGNRHPSTLDSINNLGLLLEAKGDLAAAEQLLCEALEVRRETLGNRHPSTLISINNLGLLLEAKGDLAASEQLLCKVRCSEVPVEGGDYCTPLAERF